MKNIAYRVTSISELHAIAGFEKPKHPLVSVIDYSRVNVENAPDSGSFVCSFYTVNFKKNCHFLYGRQYFDHQEGTLHCTAPEQIITFDRKRDTGGSEGWGLNFSSRVNKAYKSRKKNTRVFFFYLF